MTAAARVLTASEAALRLGVSVKALRLYEERGLLAPLRTAAGWRAYGPDAMARAADLVALRALGFSLAQMQRVVAGSTDGLEAALATHQARLEDEAAGRADAIRRIGAMRARLAAGAPANLTDLTRLAASPTSPALSLDLPWPWGGERFELREIRPLTHIVGPLGSGKTRLARLISEVLPDATFLDLERTARVAAVRQRLADDAGHAARVEATLAWLAEEGATASDALLVLVAALVDGGTGPLVVDLIDQGLDEAAQRALATWLRRRGALARPVFAMTRSSAFLDLAAVGPCEQVIVCPANHSPPVLVDPYPGAPGYEAVATCLASPAVRARTEGVVAVRVGV
ncbi:MerR family transcriptional regulator [uncultured Alsobacter sp.]|uniref:MerR family transcriptional regulator n=1 Tax=uncultured Alsobacter sp. TaxID=1748258 RepID=UPI0025F467F8|nr:MerR family transcriptional regulator [uncultured Alsobacter sp.]